MASNLHFIKTGSDTSVSSLSITNCFSDQFNVYQVVIDTIGLASSDLHFRFINASGVVSSANYDDAVLLMRSYGSFSDTNDEGATELGSIGFSDYSDKGGATVINVYTPFDSSAYSYATWQNAGASTIGTPVRKGSGVLKVAESHTGINFMASSTLQSISASIYGVK